MKAITELKINKSQIEKLANNLRNLIKSKKITEAALAKSLDLPLMTVRRIVLGETTDPRISTLKLIADYFEVSMDSLVNGEEKWTNYSDKKKPRFVPILDWNIVSSLKNIKDIQLDTWSEWQPIALTDEMNISQHAFALESRPSMHPRYPMGTLLIFDPDETPNDGDVLLIKMINGNSLALRELIIDLPKWQLHSIVPGSENLFYDEKEHRVIGVVVLTMFYPKREKGKNI